MAKERFVRIAVDGYGNSIELHQTKKHFFSKWKTDEVYERDAYFKTYSSIDKYGINKFGK